VRQADVTPLQQVHPVVCVLSQANPVGHAADADFGQEQLHHAVDHGRRVAYPQRLPYQGVRHKLVGVLDQL